MECKGQDFAVAHLKENNGGNKKQNKKKVKRSTDGEGSYYSYSEEWIVVGYAVLELIVVFCFVMGVLLKWFFEIIVVFGFGKKMVMVTKW